MNAAMRAIVLMLLSMVLATAAQAATPDRMPDRVLAGSITRADYQHYRRIFFTVPRGTARIIIAFDHDQREAKTVIDIGVEDQYGFRGASGGDKRDFTISESDATPSYLPGRIDPGRWALMLAIPNIRSGIIAHWKARIWFLKAGETSAAMPPPVADRGPGWYRGDLHLHSGHSDGKCASQGGQMVPCPLFKTLETAAARGLDFVAITDHNTTSAQAAMREAAPYFDRLLVIPGREVTTFYGHFNIFGVTEFIDYRVQPRGPVTFKAIVDRVHALGGLVSINHPALPSGEPCMGCGWAMPAAEHVPVDAIEVVNGGTAKLQRGVEGPFSGLAFWLKAVQSSGPITAIGGSDNHDGSLLAAEAGTVGRPATIVYADGLSAPAILAGIRRGRVFVDLDATPGSLLDLQLAAGNDMVPMGSRLAAGKRPVSALVRVSAPVGSRLEILDGDMVVATVLLDNRADYVLPIEHAHPQSIIRAIIRASDKSIKLISNAVIVTD